MLNHQKTLLGIIVAKVCVTLHRVQPVFRLSMSSEQPRQIFIQMRFPRRRRSIKIMNAESIHRLNTAEALPQQELEPRVALVSKELNHDCSWPVVFT